MKISMKKIISIFIGIQLLCVSLVFADSAGESYVPRFGSSGTVPISLQLDASLFSGEAFTVVPITILPATANIQNKIKLVLEYRSGGGNSWVGKGWELEPGYITRPNKFGAGNSSNPYLLSLNGETHELVSIGSGQYRTKNETFKRIQFSGSVWQVWEKDGTEYKFETSSAGRWVLTKVTDIHGVSINLSYNRPNSEQIYLSEINYPVGAGLTPYCKVKFITESRSDVPLSYYYGSLYRINQRLKQIEILAEGRLQKKYALNYTTDGSSQICYLNSITEYGKNGTALPATTFSYKQPVSSSIFQSSGEWGSVTNPFTIEDGYTAAIGYIPAGLDIGIIDMNGDALPDLIGCRLKATSPAFKYDWVVRLNTGSGFSSSELKWLDAEQSYYLFNFGGVTMSQSFSLSRRTTLADMNKDGLPDLVYSKYGGNINFGAQTLGIDSVYVRYNTGNGFFGTETKFLDYTQAYSTFENVMYIYRIGESAMLSDMNGDGLPDLVYNKQRAWVNYGGLKVAAKDWVVRLNTGSGFSSTENIWLNYSNSYFTYEDVNGPFSNKSRVGVIDIVNNATLIDINNDGLPDLVYNDFAGSFKNCDYGNCAYGCSYNWKVRYNTGSAFSDGPVTLISNAPIYFYQLNSVPQAKSVRIGHNGTFADVNGDGLVDFVFNQYQRDTADHPTVSWKACLNLGNQFAGATDLLGALGYTYNGGVVYSNVSTYNSYFIDVNKDGVADFIYPKFTEQSYNNVKFGLQVYANKNTTSTGLLTRQTSPYGGTTSMEYASSANFDNTGGDGKNDLFFVMPVVSKITKNPGVGKSGVTLYSYEGGNYDIPNRQFRGFRYVKITDPLGYINHNYFHQDNPRLGKLERQENSILKAYNTYKQDSSAPYFTPLVQLDEYTDSQCRRTTYQYDDYGNVIKTNYYGDINKTGDEKSVLADFAINSSSWLVGLPSRERIFTDMDGGGTLIAETQYLYDNNSNYADTPTKGDLTKSKRFLDKKGVYLENSFVYNGYGLEMSRTDAKNYTTYIDYDSLYQAFPSTIRNPKGQIERMTYNDSNSSFGLFGQMRSKVDTNGNETFFEYDQFGRKTRVIGPYDTTSTYGTESYEYGMGGPGSNYILMRTTEDSGTANHFIKVDILDGFERVIQMAKESEDTQVYSDIATFYNERGETEKASLPYFKGGGLCTSYVAPDGSVKWTQYSYDAIGRMTQIIKPDNTNLSNTYYGWTTTVTDENGHQKEFVKDAYDRLVSVKEKNAGDEYITNYGYNALDALILITDHLGNKFQFEYDSLKRRTKMDDPDLGVWLYDYDNNSNLIKSTNGNGKIINYTYDELNRILIKDYADSPGTDIAYVYDETASTNGIGRRTSMRDLSGSARWNYDKEGRVSSLDKTVEGVVYKVRWEYDAMGMTRRVVLPNFKEIFFTHNNGGFVENIDGYVSNVDYDASGKQSRVDFNNSITTYFEYYDDNKRLKRISAGVLQDLNYEYDYIGNVSRISDLVRAFTKIYNYDDLDRLRDGDDNTYEYNAIGNITKLNGKNFLYPVLQRPHAVINDGLYEYAYDSCGNMISGAGRQISYDSENRPISVIKDGKTTTFFYDGDGHRIKKVVRDSSVTTITIYIDNLYEKEIVY